MTRIISSTQKAGPGSRIGLSREYDARQQANRDRLARELYDRDRRCPLCGEWVCLANQLQGQCPHCQAFIMAGPILPERAQEMLDELKTRRRELGLIECEN
jgi:hypothetical protein